MWLGLEKIKGEERVELGEIKGGGGNGRRGMRRGGGEIGVGWVRVRVNKGMGGGEIW